MSENKLSLEGSEQYRKKMIVKNLPPYNVDGNFTPAQEPINYETQISVNDTVIDTQNISNGLITDAKYETIPNKYGSEGGKYLDGADFIGTITLANPVNSVTENQTSSPVFPPKSEYDYSDAKLDLVNEFFIDNSEILNRFVPNEGYEDMFIVTDTIVQKDIQFNGVYPEFVQGTYSMLDLISNNDATQNDSYIQKIGAERLKFSFEERVFEEIRKNTLGRINIINQPDISLFVTGQVPLTDKNWKITVPDGLLDTAFSLAQRITGTYYPQSPIEGDYFETPQRRSTKAGQLLQRGLKNLSNSNSPSQKFLANTGSGQKSSLFANLDYNKYKPNYSNKENFYVGNQNLAGALIMSPADDVPKNAEGTVTTTTVYGPDKLATLFDGNQNFQFGMASKTFDERPVFDGGFVWIEKRRKKDAFKKVGEGGEKFGKNNASNPLRSSFDQVLSTDYEFRDGSILDATQRIIDSTPNRGKDRLAHVGNAINQVSKVFWDGYKEITKGSKVKKYVNKEGKEVGQEYGRVFAKDNPYFTYSNLQSTIANTSGSETNGNIRRFSYSVLDSTYNLNITPFKNGGTSVKDGKVKKYMLSIENLAWKGSPEYEQLPACEKGPNGGRIMWFPPYDLTFNDSSNAQWNGTNFLGRPEPIYTYQNSSRSGSIGFKIVVDYPAVMNLIVNKELNKEDNYVTQQVMNSFFAGLKKYDIYELAKKFNSLSLGTIQEAYQAVLDNKNATAEDIQGVADGLNSGGDIDNSENTQVEGWQGIAFYFNPKGDNKKNYDDVYQDVVNNLTAINTDKSIGFNANVVEYNYGELESIRTQIINILDGKKGKIKLEVTPGLSPVNDNDISESITKFFEVLGGDKFIESRDLEIEVLPFQNSVNPKSIPDVNIPYSTGCDNNQYNNNDPVQSYACSSALITNITVTPNPPQPEGETQNNLNRPNTNINNGLPTQPTTDIIDKSKNISKKILRELLVESDYFEMLQQDNPFVYDSIKQKIKYFNPAFHSITPEGLNSRITFLNQCVRPGRTMPTRRGEDLVYNDSFNTNFGTPPVLILRVGDFYNTKIIPDSVSFTYENLDINPEGIGVQPMIASVTIQFKMIGGHGLKEPIEKLQNALSFNYYANTEMYDDRADVTEDTTELDNDLINSIFNQEPLATINDVGNLSQNEAGDTIGQILTSTPSTGTSQTGTISYTNFFDNIVDQTKVYFDETTKYISSTIDQYGYGLFSAFSNKRKFYTGELNEYGTAYDTKIFGKTNGSSDIAFIKRTLVTKITLGNDNISKALSQADVSPIQILKVSNNFKKLVRDKESNGFNDLFASMDTFSNSQAQYNQNFRKLDLVLTSTDGKILNNGEPKIYDLSGTTEISDLVADYQIISQDLNDYIENLANIQVYPKGDNNRLQETTIGEFIPFVEGSTLNPGDFLNYMYSFFATDIIDSSKRNTFKESLLKGVDNEEVSNIVDKELNTIAGYFTEEKTKEMEVINGFFQSTDYQKFSNYNPQRDNTSIKGKTRTLNFETDLSAIFGVLTQKNRLKKIYSSENSGLDRKFNDKKKFA